MTLTIDDHIKLELTAQKHAEDLFNTLNENRDHLSKFLPWVGNMQSADDFRIYIRNCESMYMEQQEISFVILLDGKVVGRVGLHHLDLSNRNAAIGYWLSKHVEGKGIMTRCCAGLISYGFEQLGLQRIEIKAATANLRSQAIPVKLGFKQEGVLKQSELVGGKFLDLILFAMLRDEWNK